MGQRVGDRDRAGLDRRRIAALRPPSTRRHRRRHARSRPAGTAAEQPAVVNASPAAAAARPDRGEGQPTDLAAPWSSNSRHPSRRRRRAVNRNRHVVASDCAIWIWRSIRCRPVPRSNSSWRCRRQRRASGEPSSRRALRRPVRSGCRAVAQDSSIRDGRQLALLVLQARLVAVVLLVAGAVPIPSSVERCRIPSGSSPTDWLPGRCDAERLTVDDFGRVTSEPRGPSPVLLPVAAAALCHNASSGRPTQPTGRSRSGSACSRCSRARIARAARQMTSADV